MDILHPVPMLILLLLVPTHCTYDGRVIRQGLRDKEDSRIYLQRENLCKEAPPRELRQVLGSAYNEFYMSFDPPQGASLENDRFDRDSGNSTVQNHPFFVKEDLEVVLSEEPAWKYDFAVDPVPTKEGFPAAPVEHQHRSKKSVPGLVLDAIGRSGDTHFQWHCEAPLRWTDLGRDYYPRYILSVDCNVRECQGTRFKCESRSFAIKVLRKREGLCDPEFNVHRDTEQIGVDQMPSSLRDYWVWEMRAIPFCCVCQYK